MEKIKEQVYRILNATFSDFKIENETLLKAKIKSMVLHKRRNKLNIWLICVDYVEIDDLIKFEEYIKEKYQLKEVETRIELEQEQDQVEHNQEEKEDITPVILENWNKIIGYITNKSPFEKTILKNSKIELEDNKLLVTILYKGKDYLEKNKFNSVLENTLFNLYGKKLKVEFKESENLVRNEIDKVDIKEIIKQNQLATNNNNNNKEEQNKDKPNKETNSKQNEKTNEENNNKEQKDTNDIKEVKSTGPLIYGRNAKIDKTKITKITDLKEDSGKVVIKGKVCIVILDGKNAEDTGINLIITTRELMVKGKKKVLISVPIYDGTETIICKIFANIEQSKDIIDRLQKSTGVLIEGNAGFDSYSKEIGIIANNIVEEEFLDGNTKKREDTAEVKRVELHMHTNMSQLDGITGTTDLIKRAMKWGWKSLAITDHFSVQGFPEAHQMLGFDNKDIKILYGMEANMVNDLNESVFFSKGQSIDTTYCILDTETTGRSFRTDKLTEIGVMKVKDGKVIDEFETKINPERPIPEEVVKLTNITDEMVKDAPKVDEAMPKFLEFIGDSVLVAHNADFDMGFLKYNAKQLGLEFNNSYIDTLSLSRSLYPELKRFKLGVIAEHLGIEVEVAHRALADVDTTVKVFNKMIETLKEKGAKTIDDIDKLESGKADFKTLFPYHATILAKDYVGLKNLYKIVSYSHLNYFYRTPRVLNSLYKKYSEGLLLGSACQFGEIYQGILLGKADEEIEDIAKNYDYLEIQPIENNMNLVEQNKVGSKEDLIEINKKIVALGEKLGKLVVATGDVHYLDPQDGIGRAILLDGAKLPDGETLQQQYLRTTDEMLEEFSYLGEEKAYEVVVTNTNKIADLCDNISPISPEKCPPYIDNCEQTIRDIAYNKAHELYGEDLPQIVEERMNKELDSIINNGFSVMYIIAQRLVWKSNEDGFIVGSRGSVGSSFVAFLTGITEVNSLKAHYRCEKCKYSDFGDYGVKNGFDLPNKKCPKCGEELTKDGMDIPFETFLGFKGDKEPDIDLNFSGLYQAKAHKYTEVIFGKGTTFKAGTVETVAAKTAIGFVKKYNEGRGIPQNREDTIRTAKSCSGVKRTTGQHPGGIIVVPKGREIFEFTPVQHPADDPKSDIITTHFDYHKIDQNLLKLDILGHDDPTMIRMLYDISGFDPTKAPLDDKETMSIFSSTKALGVTPEELNSEVGTYGVPEYGTKFVRGMLVDTKPKTFDELIRISGLSHGTDVWLNNAQELIENGTVKLEDAICCRDDIMLYLIDKGLPKDTSFKIMESVRKGKVAKGKEAKWPEYMEMMKEHGVPDWYIDSCKKIKYMFPKAHAAAYVTNAFRIAWFKVHKPEAYYCAYFTIRADKFDYNEFCQGLEKVKNKMKEIEIKVASKEATKAEQDLYDVAEIVKEMYLRKINFKKIDLYNSHATNFTIEGNEIRPPLNSVPGVGTVDATKIMNARNEGGKFMSIQDLKIRAGIGKTTIETLRNIGCLDGMDESNQISLFNM